LRLSYIHHIFNQQLIKRRGVAFHLLAGTPIIQAFKSPCTDVPSDLVVSLGNAAAIELQLDQSPVLHTSLASSPKIFRNFVQPLLQKTAGEFQAVPDPPVSDTARQPDLQFTRVFTGHVVRTALRC